jgi:hypothetical protein
LLGLALLGVACGEDKPGSDTQADSEVAPDTAGDTGETSDPGDTADTSEDGADTTGPEVDAVGPECAELALTGSLEANDVAGVFTLGGEVDLGLGDPGIPDIVVFELFSDEAGTFRLGQGANENYATCNQCVRVIEDASSGSARQFFPTAGAIEVEYLGSSGREVRFTLSGLEMVEVTIRQADLRSVPVEDGGCYRRVGAFSLETAACVATCGDHVCGDDGCGGVCGDGCQAGVCSLDGLRCEADGSTCQDVTVAGTLANPAAGVYRLSLTELGLGAVSATDFLQIEFYENATGGFSLGAGTNRNYRTCGQCVRLIVDGSREFFQREGLLTVSPASEPIAVPGEDAFVDLTFSGVVLQEVTLDDEFNSTPKPGGACVRLLVDGPLRSTEL